ncbi:Retinol dehydrogenase 10-B [Bulinus truncatus]|nr:Retinol dehydrogenase 10-B [Bulinus truncatus]
MENHMAEYQMVSTTQPVLAYGCVPDGQYDPSVLASRSSGGVGRLLAERFAEKGCRLVLWDVNEKLNKQTLHSVQTNHAADAVAYTVDLSDRDAIYKTADKVRDEFGPVDILVNNAGVVFGKYVMDADDRQMVKTMEVNCFAHYWRPTRASLQISQQFINTSSLSNILVEAYESFVTNITTIYQHQQLVKHTGMADYCASKFASVGFEESLRMELAQRGITSVKTTVVCPFLIDTGMFEGCKMRVEGKNETQDWTLCSNTKTVHRMTESTSLELTGILVMVLALALTVAVYVITVSEGAPSCLLQCMKDVLKCKREESAGITPDVDCCDKYTLCYFMCVPDAETAPSCSSAKGKRGRWNKRSLYDKKSLIEEGNDFDNHFY